MNICYTLKSWSVRQATATMHGSNPAAAPIAVTFLLWDLFELVQRIRENRKARRVRSESNKKKNGGGRMRIFLTFMATASVANAVVHVAEAG
jgi:hypothetical protein